VPAEVVPGRRAIEAINTHCAMVVRLLGAVSGWAAAATAALSGLIGPEQLDDCLHAADTFSASSHVLVDHLERWARRADQRVRDASPGDFLDLSAFDPLPPRDATQAVDEQDVDVQAVEVPAVEVPAVEVPAVDEPAVRRGAAQPGEGIAPAEEATTEESTGRPRKRRRTERRRTQGTPGQPQASMSDPARLWGFLSVPASPGAETLSSQSTARELELSPDPEWDIVQSVGDGQRLGWQAALDSDTSNWLISIGGHSSGSHMQGATRELKATHQGWFTVQRDGPRLVKVVVNVGKKHDGNLVTQVKERFAELLRRQAERQGGAVPELVLQRGGRWPS
jgi:hypothetical protein